MPTDTSTPRPSWLRRFVQWWGECNECSTPDCHNPAGVFGACVNCIADDWILAEREVERKKHVELKSAVKSVLLEIETEESLDTLDHPSGIEASVCEDIADRQKKGISKYGVTVAENPLPLKQWLQHAYEETLDKAIYLKRAIAEIEKTAPAAPLQTSCSGTITPPDEAQL